MIQKSLTARHAFVEDLVVDIVEEDVRLPLHHRLGDDVRCARVDRRNNLGQRLAGADAILLKRQRDGKPEQVQVVFSRHLSKTATKISPGTNPVTDPRFELITLIYLVARGLTFFTETCSSLINPFPLILAKQSKVQLIYKCTL